MTGTQWPATRALGGGGSYSIIETQWSAIGTQGGASHLITGAQWSGTGAQWGGGGQRRQSLDHRNPVVWYRGPERVSHSISCKAYCVLSCPKIHNFLANFLLLGHLQGTMHRTARGTFGPPWPPPGQKGTLGPPWPPLVWRRGGPGPPPAPPTLRHWPAGPVSTCNEGGFGRKYKAVSLGPQDSTMVLLTDGNNLSLTYSTAWLFG